jgi:hypothetical protein
MILALISYTRLPKNENLYLTFSTTSISRQAALTTFKVIRRMLPLLESKTFDSILSKSLFACSKVSFDMKRFKRKHLASNIPLDLEKELTRRELIF